MEISTENNWYKNFNLLIFDEIDSTNEEAKRLCHAGIKENFIIWAKSQTKGKGRQGKKWISPENNLYLSLLIRPNCTASEATNFSFLAAIAAGEAIKENSINCNSLEYKWPNDLMFNKKKFGGILLESSLKSNSEHIDWLVIGIGINIFSYPMENIQYPATSLKEAEIDISCEKLLGDLMKNFAYYYKKWEIEGFENIRLKWIEKAMNLGKVITINTNQYYKLWKPQY
ncbi:MAG: biotin--[acetyl-CoA-carboxylase] ligase [Alphaproteobacteria bacterium]